MGIQSLFGMLTKTQDEMVYGSVCQLNKAHSFFSSFSKLKFLKKKLKNVIIDQDRADLSSNWIYFSRIFNSVLRLRCLFSGLSLATIGDFSPYPLAVILLRWTPLSIR